MKTRNLINAFVIASAMMVTLTAGTSTLWGQKAGSRLASILTDDSANELVGVWEAVNVPAENDCATGQPIPGTPMIRVLNTFSQGGTGWLEDNAPFDGPYRSTGATIWKRTSGRNYTYLNLHYTFDPDKTFVFTITQRSNLTLSKDGNSFTENGTFDLKIPDGTVIYSGCFNAESRRITF